MLISVTIPVYNDPEGLRLSLSSLIDQSYKNWEAIVVDDGSSEDLNVIISNFNDDRIIFHRFEKNKGRPFARQKTFELLSGRYCAFLDAGDAYNRDFLERAVSVFQSGSYIGVSQSMTITFDNESYLSSYTESSFYINDSRFNQISFASTIFSSEVVNNYKFNEKLKYSQDRHFLNHIATNFDGKISLLDSHGYYYHQGNKMSVSTTFNKYYYDTIRLFDERKVKDGLKNVGKLFLIPLIHLFFGYKYLLKMRFKKV